MPKKDNKRIPNIAEELAKNRNQVKGASPSPANTLSSSPMFPQPSQAPATDCKPSNKSGSSEKGEDKHTIIKTEQIKISSLLSPNEEMGNSPTVSPQPPFLSDGSPSPSQHALGGPKVILPTQKPGSNPLQGSDSSDSPGFLVARISSPVNLPIKLASSMKKSHSTTAVTPASTSKSTTNSASTISKGNLTGGNNKTTVVKAKKSHSVSSVASSKSKTGGSKSSNDSKKKINAKSVKKDSSASSNAVNLSANKQSISTNDKKEINRKQSQSSKLPITKKDASTANGPGNSADNKKKGLVKKEPSSGTKPKTPKKLVPPPQIKSPSLLEVLERGKSDKVTEDPIVVVDVPLYSTKNNDYLDENGQVVFNYYKLVHDKMSTQSNTNLADEKLAKRNLLGQLNHTTSNIESIEVTEGDDIVEDEEDGEDEDEEEVDDEKTTTSPKKRPHSNKGKSLIGKYDIEDPFIDDSELLWEEQRAATKDGFFVYFGPLIEKGHYASLERVDGTMKRGGVKNK